MRMRILNKNFEGDTVYQLLVDHLPDMVHAVGPDGNIIYANYTSEKLLGYAREEMLAMHVCELYAEDLREVVRSGFDHLKETGVKRGRSILQTKGGAQIPVMLFSYSIYDDDNNFVQDITVFKDMR